MSDSSPHRAAPRIHPDSVYTIAQLNRLLGLNEQTVRRERKLGRLRTTQRAHRVFILGKWVIEWLEAGEVTQAAASPPTTAPASEDAEPAPRKRRPA